MGNSIIRPHKGSRNKDNDNEKERFQTNILNTPPSSKEGGWSPMTERRGHNTKERNNIDSLPRERRSSIDSMSCAGDESGMLQEASDADGGIPTPQLFALMRLGHEVIRGAMRDIRELLFANHDMNSSSELTTAERIKKARSLWRELYQFMNIHQAMEEGEGKAKGFFCILDEFTSSDISSLLHETHEALDEYEQALHYELHRLPRRAQLHLIQEAFLDFEHNQRIHLRQEEKIMMPAIMSALQKKRGSINIQKLMTKEIMPCLARNEKLFCQFAMCMLEKHHDGKPRARVFAQAIWACSSEYQWTRRKHFIETSIKSSDLYIEICNCCRR